MSKYSIFSLLRNALSYHENWAAAWRSPEPKKEYDALIIGGGGHGLATAYYLAKEHGMTNIAVLEKGWIGGGNTGRNTTIVRSNYLWDESAHLYEKSMKLWEGLSQDLNYNVMFSQRGVYNLGHNLQDMRDIQRRVNANRLNGIDGHVVTPAEIKRAIPEINIDQGCRYPILGASFQPRGGVARHDAVAWGFARGADMRGVDIIQNCEVTAIRQENGAVTGVETTRGTINAKKIGVVVAGHCSVDQAGHQYRHHVERGARLHQPVRQRRPGHRRGYRQLQRLRPAWQLPDHRAHRRGDMRNVPDISARAHESSVGRYSRHRAGRLSDHR
jgi:sarcosine oxidase subunit beta